MVLGEKAASQPVENGSDASTQAQCNKVCFHSTTVAGTVVKFSDSIGLLGVKLDPVISVNRHVTELVRSCNYLNHALRHIRPLLTLESTKMVALGIVAAQMTTATCSSAARQ